MGVCRSPVEKPMSAGSIPAVVLAGGKPGEALATASGVRYKALVPVRGRPMVAYVLEALAACERVSAVHVVAPEEVAAALPGVRHVADTGSCLGNLTAGGAACEGARFSLVITCDIPFVTAEALAAFIALAEARDVDLAYPIVELGLCNERFPGMRRTSLRLREGRFTGGNAVLIRPAFLQRNAGLIEEAFAARKQPLRLARMVGWDLVPRILLASKLPGLLPLSLAEERVQRLVGGRVAAIPLAYPEIGADIDKPEDLGPLVA